MVLTGLLMLGACGGGAGGGPASPPPAPPPSPPPDNSNQPLTITPANAIDVALFGITVPESLIQLLLSMVNGTVALANTQGALSVTQSCPPGDATITLTDRDTDGFLSSGDRVTLRFAGRCFNEALNDEVTGEMAVELASVSMRADGDIALAGQLIITDSLRITEPGSGAGAAGIRVSGRFEFSVVAGTGRHPELIYITHIPGSPLVVTLVDDASRQTSEQIRDFSVRRELFQVDPINTGFHFQFDFINESQLLNGRIRCVTSSTLSGRFSDRPNDGRVSCRGAGVAEVSIVARQASFGATADVLLDASGGGSPVNVAFPNGTFGGWDGLTEGIVFTVTIHDVTARPGAGEPPELVGTRLHAAVNDAAYDEVRDRIYVSNAAGIVVLDARSLAVIDTVTVPGTPGALALSDDGSVLWFAHAGDSFIQALSTADLTLGTPVPLGGSGFGPPGAYDLAVVPGRPDTVVVTMQNLRELVAYQGGIEMPRRVAPPGRVSRITFRDAHSAVATDDTTTAFWAYRIEFDPAEGLTLTRSLPELAGGFSAGLHLGNHHVITDSGQIFNEIDETLEGALPRGANLFSLDRVAVDRRGERIYGVSVLRQTLNVYRESPLALTATYRIDAPSGFAQRLLFTPHSLVVATSSGLLRLNLADLIDNLQDEPCVREDLSGLISSGRYVQLRCPFHDAVYDSTRHRLYASVPGGAGPGGNAIAIVDANSHNVVSRIPIGADAEAVVLSPDASLLYAVTRNTSKVTVIDVASQTVDSQVQLGFQFLNEATEWRPNRPQAVAVSALNPRDILVAYQEMGGVGLYSSGLQAPRRADSSRAYRSLFLRSDDQLAVATGFGVTGVFTVDSDGVVRNSDNTNLLPGNLAAQRGDRVFSSRGVILDLNSLAGVIGCFSQSERGPSDGVAPDPDSDMIYYASPSGDRTITVQGCNLANGARTTAVTYTSFGGNFGRLIGLSMAGTGQLAAVFDDRILFIDAPSM